MKAFVVLLITITLFFYFLFVVWNSSSFIDTWPLESLFVVTVAVIVIVTILSYILFQSKASIIIPLITQIFLVVMIPILRYPNMLNIIGPWDSVAHFSFTKWIIMNGHIDTTGNLFYSYEYGLHPGNGIIPATLSLMSSISIGWSMNTVLTTIYSVYILLLLSTIKTFSQSIQKETNIIKVLWILAVLTLAVNLPVYYHGTTLGYAFTSTILYIFIKLIAGKGIRPIRDIVTALLIFLGLILTHLSTAAIVSAYVLIATLVLCIISPFNKEYKERKSSRNLLVLVISMISAFVIYEVYVDVVLFGRTFRGALRHIYLRYIGELETASMAIEIMGTSPIELVQYLVSQYTKIIIILGLILIHTITLLMKWRSLRHVEKMVALLLFASYPTWLIAWAGVGTILSGYRALSVICFLLALSLALTHEKLYKPLIRNGSFIVPLVLIALGFVSNFALPFKPALKGDEGELYKYPTYSQGGFSNYILHPILYISSYTTIASPPFLCLRPYITFGLCDLMWQNPKIPIRGAIAPEVISPNSIIELIKNYIGKNVIIPQPTKDRLLPGPIGYHSLYTKPYYFLLEKSKALVYNNGPYTIFWV